jgi:hypothetical protein
MNDEPTRVVHALRETCAEDEHVYPALDLGEHKGANRRQLRRRAVLLPSTFFGLRVLRLAGVGKLCERVRDGERLGRAHVGQHLGQIPALEGTLVDEVAVEGADEALGFPALLEERKVRLDEVGLKSKGTRLAPPEVEKVCAVPALAGRSAQVQRQRPGVRTDHPRQRPLGRENIEVAHGVLFFHAPWRQIGRKK